MSKTLDRYLDDQVFGHGNVHDQRKRYSAFLAEREKHGDDGLELWAKGCDIANRVMHALACGNELDYPPIIEGEIGDSGLIVPANIPLNRGLFETFGANIVEVRISPERFVIAPLNQVVELEPIPLDDVLTALTPKELAGLRRVPATPVLRGVLA